MSTAAPALALLSLAASLGAAAPASWETMPRRGWGLQVGVLGGLGASDFAGTASPAPPPADPNNLFALFPPSNEARQEPQLSGQGGLALRLDYHRWLSLRLEAAAQSRSFQMKETITFPSGTVLKRGTAWEWSSLAFPVIVDVGWSFVLTEKLGLRPHLGGGGYYARSTSTRKRVGAEGFSASEVAWTSAPPDDLGWCATAGVDFLYRSADGALLPLLNVEARLSRGRWLLDSAAGADLAAQAIEGVLSFPVWVLGAAGPDVKAVSPGGHP